VVACVLYRKMRGKVVQLHSSHADLSSSPTPNGNSLKAKEIIWGASVAMRMLQRTIMDATPQDIPILIIGETGTGKSILALQIHRLSAHNREPFTIINCRSLTDEMNGAGLKLPSRGTAFLDNVFDVGLGVQRRVLALLTDEQDGEGELSVRFVSAARETLDRDLRSAQLLKELYFRLNGISLRIPPLRERKEDLPELVGFFLDKYSALSGRTDVKLGEEVFQRMADYSWPGNVRQLENTVRRIVATGDVAGALEDLIEVPRSTSETSTASQKSLKSAVRQARRNVERELIARALSKTHWNRKRAAQELQISYKSLLLKIKQMGVEE
jgi:two-component system response regulator AtoC